MWNLPCVRKEVLRGDKRAGSWPRGIWNCVYIPRVQGFPLCAEAKPWPPGRVSQHTCSFLCLVDLSQVPRLWILSFMGQAQPESTYSLVLYTVMTAEMALQCHIMLFSRASNSEVIASWVTISPVFECCSWRVVGQFGDLGVCFKVYGTEFTLKTPSKAKVETVHPAWNPRLA